MSTQPYQVAAGNLSIIAMAKRVVEPSVSVLALYLACSLTGDIFDVRYILLSLIILVLTFPGEWPTGVISDYLTRMFTSWLLVTTILVFLAIGSNTLRYFPLQTIVFWIILKPLLVIAITLFLKKVVNGSSFFKRRRKKAIMVGMNSLAVNFVTKVNSDPLEFVDIVGYFDSRVEPRVENNSNVPVIGKMSDVVNYCQEHQIDNVYIALPMTSEQRIISLLDDLRDTTLSIFFLPNLFLYDLIQARVDTVAEMPVVTVCESPFVGVNGIVKRVSDVVLSLLILLIISPLMLICAFGVKLSSPGPIIFKQKRYGLDGSSITVYKFRSMRVHDDAKVVKQATRDDDRITAYGAFLRKTSLDELPQFINVLQGRMSIVGPRPHAVSHNEQYRKVIKGYMIRHKVKPGITGWAQVNGFRGETDTLDKMEKRIQYDLDYLRNWSLYQDLWIIVRTVLVVFKDDNAY